MATEPVGIVNRIKHVARQVLEQSPEGIRHADLVSRIQAELPAAKLTTIAPSVSELPSTETDVLRPSRGFYILAKFADSEARPALPENGPQQPARPSQPPIAEQAYYEPLALWLKTDEEFSEAVVVGGNTFRNKWATPDVIGTYKPQPADPVEFPLELVSAEIKIDASQSVTAFGQACAYRLFSHQVYIVMPITIKDVKDDLERLEALCELFGMGLVLFKLNPADPQFERVVAARKFEPDMFYVNEFARRLRQTDPHTFNKLF
jgi:hypothetical protein